MKEKYLNKTLRNLQSDHECRIHLFYISGRVGWYKHLEKDFGGYPVKKIVSALVVTLLFLMIIPPPVYAEPVIGQNAKSATCPPSNMQILPSKGVMLKDGENMRMLLIPVEKTNSVSLIIARRQQMDFAELDRKQLPDSGSEIILSVLGSNGSILIAIVRNCGDVFFYLSYESIMHSRDIRA